MKCPYCHGSGEVKDMPIGKKLQFARESMKLTTRQVQDGCGIDYVYISQIETGRIKNPSFAKVKTLAKFYGIKIEEL